MSHAPRAWATPTRAVCCGVGPGWRIRGILIPIAFGRTDYRAPPVGTGPGPRPPRAAGARARPSVVARAPRARAYRDPRVTDRSMVNNFTNTPGYLETGQRLDLARRFRSARTSHTNHHSAECRACGPFMHRVQRFRTETARSASTRKAGNTTQDSLVSFLSQAGCGSGPKSAQSATTVNNRRCTRIWSRASHSPASSIATSFILSSGGKR